MATVLNQFNSISAIYDRMSRVVYGTTLHDAQCHFIAAIPDRSKILIIGGGSGKFLLELMIRKPNVSITYVEASSNMISLAKEKVDNDPRVMFIHGTQDSIPENLKVDHVITPFFLDLFSDQSLRKVIAKLKVSLVKNGVWIATDFTQSAKLSHRILMWVMYLFFRLTTGIEAKQLPAWELQLFAVGKEIESRTFMNGFVKTTCYRING